MFYAVNSISTIFTSYASALIGHGVNEIVTVGVAEAYDVKIVDIEFTA